MTTLQNIILLSQLIVNTPPIIWFLGKNNLDERCPAATALSRSVAVGL